MPTDIRTSPSGMVRGSVAQRRRRSNVDSTPPSEVACTHSVVRAGQQVAGDRRPCDSTIETMPAEARVADLVQRRVPGEPTDQLLGVGLGPLHPQVQGPQPAQREPRLERPGDRADQVAAALERGVHARRRG